jgi:hypothetical protein
MPTITAKDAGKGARMPVLMGPADADHFRIKVGRFGDRFYCDPLPACDIADATDATWPSISTVKKASGQDWSYVAMKRCAQAVTIDPALYAGNDVEAAYEQFKVADKRLKNIAFNRGSIVHLWMEDLLDGQPMREFSPFDLEVHRFSAIALEEAKRYQDAIAAWHNAYEPQLVAKEVVCIHRTLNGVGYGGTADAIIRIDGKLYMADWKSRGSDHDAYAEEAAQVAALAGAEYMIVVDDDGSPVRRLIPPLDGGLIVSIKTDGCRTYPVTL